MGRFVGGFQVFGFEKDLSIVGFYATVQLLYDSAWDRAFRHAFFYAAAIFGTGRFCLLAASLWDYQLYG